MTLITSSNFASSAASGTDWRDICRRILEDLEAAKTKDGQFNIGFLYVSDVLADDVEGILNLFKSVTGIKNWVGCIALGVCGQGADFVDQPAISAMVGTLEDNSFHLFPQRQNPNDRYGLYAAI